VEVKVERTFGNETEGNCRRLNAYCLDHKSQLEFVHSVSRTSRERVFSTAIVLVSIVLIEESTVGYVNGMYIFRHEYIDSNVQICSCSCNVRLNTKHQIFSVS